MFELKVSGKAIEPITKAVQKGIKDTLEKKVSKLVCSEHGEGVKVTITKDSYSFKCCCDSFRAEVDETLRS